jgi:hypothetical protein
MNTTETQRAAAWFDAAHAFPLQPHLLCLAYVGSHAHGTYVPPSDPDAIDDVDLMGIVLPPARYTIGLTPFEHWTCQREELDIVCYALHKFVRLCLKGNPNVLGLLWLREQEYLLRTPTFLQLQAARDLFSAKSVYDSFAGYANGQLHRMTSYSPEIQAEIDTLTEVLERAGWHLQDIMDGRTLPMPRGLAVEDANAKRERLRMLRARYHAAYMGEKRRRLVVRHGYDTKNAAHLVRLLDTCVEFFETGQLAVYREHSDHLKAIKRGEWTLDAVKAHAEQRFADAKRARDASTLPAAPDREAIDTLLVQLTQTCMDAAA